MTLRIGWFTTARGSGSRALFEEVRDAIRARALDAEIAFVFCNREAGEDPVTDEFLTLVRRSGVPVETLSSVHFRKSHHGARSTRGMPLPEWRTAYDEAITNLTDKYHADIGVSAGYMLIFSAQFVKQHTILNLHPALPGGPIGTWREVICELIRTGASSSGVMTNVATPEVDAGPVPTFCTFSIRGAEFDRCWEEVDPAASDDCLMQSSLFTTIRSAGIRREAPFLVSTLQSLAEGQIRIHKMKVRNLSGRLAPPLDLTMEVETRLEGEQASRFGLFSKVSESTLKYFGERAPTVLRRITERPLRLANPVGNAIMVRERP